MFGVRRKGNWLLATGISLLLSISHLREEDLFSNEDEQVAWSLIEARQQARHAKRQQRLADQACRHLYSLPSYAHLDDGQHLHCVVNVANDPSTPYTKQP